MALNEAKRTHQRWVRYETAIDHSDPDRLALLGQLREALTTNQLEVYLQPQHLSPGMELIGAEALVRWNHPERGMIPPLEFIPLAEHSAMAGILTRNVLRASLEASNRLRSVGIDITISVNLTSRDLLDRTLPGTVAAALVEYDVPAQRIAFEVTESSLIVDLKAAVATLAALQELGCQTSADDFGTGYASLQYLQQLPLNEVKIDQSFVAGSVTNANDEAIVRSVTQLIHELGLRVVAEGIEDEPTLELICDLGCDLLQGYYFSRPLPVDSFLDYATARQGVPVAGG
jgi:EAL domain-containing protein (putative c-di-GMP-specific phosphodiesterase class I)